MLYPCRTSALKAQPVARQAFDERFAKRRFFRMYFWAFCMFSCVGVIF